MKVKAELARRIVTDFHDVLTAELARQEFERVFQRREAPEHAPERVIDAVFWESAMTRGTRRVKIARLIAPLVHVSRTEAERLVKQGAVEIDGSRVDDAATEIDLSMPKKFLLRVGKHTLLRVKITV
jgi:tyrosyl-tRNA synthetase